jgi:hypothetical protein
MRCSPVQRYLVEQPITLAGRPYRPGDVVRLAQDRGTVLARAGKVTLLPQEALRPLERTGSGAA